ncbi:MAG: alpha-L-fucosidase, partial [Bacteroidales bacterium]|nr:alpha-L-fucosidase [Bacteroidales bacterium]
GLSLDIGQPVSDVAAQYGAGHFEGNSKIILSTMGCLVTNLAWFIPLSIRNKTLKELRLKSGKGVKTNLVNYLLAALSGSLWYFQFFFYGLAHVRMGVFEFASWVIHMSMLIFFSYIIGVLLKEWRKVTRKTYVILVIGLMVLFVSFLIMNRGLVLGERSNGKTSVKEEPFSTDWESMKQYRVPDWFRDAKIGIYFHWGVYSVPAYKTEWYSHYMYVPDHPIHEYHTQTYGPVNEFGYKDFIPMFTAEKFTADE